MTPEFLIKTIMGFQAQVNDLQKEIELMQQRAQMGTVSMEEIKDIRRRLSYLEGMSQGKNNGINITNVSGNNEGDLINTEGSNNTIKGL